ncbi:unnamed protein product [Linum trigynum]|uniref:Uncharacterized protein n=1 Tax=Linum trigynum TaxID=586398 RepID=A0AAV2GVE3_9ROSI
MYLVGGGGGPLDIVLSGGGHLVHGPFDGRCKARNLNTLIPPVPVLRFRACPSVWSVSILSGSEAYTCSLIMTVRQGLFPPPFSAHS